MQTITLAPGESVMVVAPSVLQPPPPKGVVAARARDFTALWGINTHIGIAGAYSNLPTVAANVKYLGASIIRDSISDATVIPSWQQVAGGTGARYCNYMPEGAPAWCEQALALMPKIPIGLLAYLEGPNEEDDAYALAQGNSIVWAKEFQKRVWSMGQMCFLPVINLSFGSGWTADNNWAGNYDKVGDLSGFCNFGNAHIYPQAATAPAKDVARGIELAGMAAPARPVIETEFGYPQSGQGAVLEILRAQYAVLALANAYQVGLKGLWWYGLYDDISGTWGLFNVDGTPRLAGMAMHNLMVILADTGAPAASFQPTALDFTLSPKCENILLQRSDGVFFLLLWQPSTPGNVVLTLPAPKLLKTFDPTIGLYSVVGSATAQSRAIPVPTYPIVVQIG